MLCTVRLWAIVTVRAATGGHAGATESGGEVCFYSDHTASFKVANSAITFCSLQSGWGPPSKWCWRALRTRSRTPPFRRGPEWLTSYAHVSPECHSWASRSPDVLAGNDWEPVSQRDDVHEVMIGLMIHAWIANWRIVRSGVAHQSDPAKAVHCTMFATHFTRDFWSLNHTIFVKESAKESNETKKLANICLTL